MDTSLTSTPEPQGALAQAQAAYMATQQELLKKIMDRESNKDIPWFSIAGSLLKPTRTGALGESLGNAGDVMGQWQENQKKEELTNAQMRAQITKSILDSMIEQNAGQEFAKLANGSPTAPTTPLPTSPVLAPPVNLNAPTEATSNPVQTPTAIQGTALAPATGSKIERYQSGFPTVGLSTKYGPVLKSMIEFENQNRNAENEAKKIKLQEQDVNVKLSDHDVSVLQKLENYDLRNLDNLPSSVKAMIHSLSPEAKQILLQAPVATSVNTTSTPVVSGATNTTPLPSGPLPNGMVPTAPNLSPAVTSALNSAGVNVAPNKSPMSGFHPELQPNQSTMTQQGVFAPQGLGTKPVSEAQQKLLEEQQKTDIDNATKKAQFYLDQTRDVTDQKISQAQRLETLTKNPKIWGVLNSKEGDSIVAKGAKLVGQLLDEGANLNLNQFTARLGLPVTNLYNNATLDDTDKHQLAEAVRILSAMRVQTAKEKPFGAAPSNFEDKIQLGAMPSTSDLPKTVAAYAREQRLNAEYIAEHNKGIYADKKAYEEQFKSPYPYRYYFDPNRKGSPFNMTEDAYKQHRQALYDWLDKQYQLR